MEKIKIHFLNTIWSDAIILQVDNHYAFIDTGTDFYYPMIKKHLDDLNIKKIDFVLLTHFHSDHYGCISYLINDYKVDKLYLKKYYGLDGSTSGGMKANESYINDEEIHYNLILNQASINNTNIIYLDQTNEDTYIIDFYGIDIELYDIENCLFDIYNDKNSLYYNQRVFGENFNSIGVFFMVNKFSVLLGADLTCEKHEINQLDNKAIKLVNKIYQKHNINHIDVFKSCHHGHSYNNPKDLLKLINPNFTIITNTPKWVDNFSTCMDLKQINPEGVILLTDYHKYLFTIDEKISYETIDDTSLFIILKRNNLNIPFLIRHLSFYFKF